MKPTTPQDLFHKLQMERERIELAFDRMCSSLAMHPETYYASSDDSKQTLFGALKYLDSLDANEGMEVQRHLILDPKLDKGMLYYNVDPLPTDGLVTSYEVLQSCPCGDKPVYPLWILAPETIQ